ncbi:MAG: hypothetical protein M1368_00445 [Thaumarchaeota archaeon]|nr:hypothetical protein [Nitrososphaerota archaeon]
MVISTKNVEMLPADGVSDQLTALLDTILETHDHLVINSDLTLSDKDNKRFDDSNHARRIYTEMSRDGFCIFYVTTAGMMFFVDGNDFGDLIFCSARDMQRYNEKKDLSQLAEVIDEYRNKLRDQTRYSKFFVTKGTLERIFPPSQFERRKNLLKNKPENHLRNDLVDFLKSNIQGAFQFAREFLLDSAKRLDIWTNDGNGNWIIIEVKWIGESINPKDRKIGRRFSPQDIKDKAVPQVLGYIKEAREDGKYYVKAGYLVVYDARKDKNGDSLDTTDLTYVRADLHPYTSLFHKFPDLAVDNIQPS